MKNAEEHGTNIDAPAGPKTLWDFVKSGRLGAEKRVSRHRQFTHSRKPKQAKKQARKMAQASRRRNRSQKPRKKSGISPVRKKRHIA